MGKNYKKYFDEKMFKMEKVLTKMLLRIVESSSDVREPDTGLL